MIRASNGRVITKIGAQGFYGASVPDLGLGIALHVDEKNKAARKVYERVGYREIGTYRLTLFPPAH